MFSSRALCLRPTFFASLVLRAKHLYIYQARKQAVIRTLGMQQACCVCPGLEQTSNQHEIQPRRLKMTPKSIRLTTVGERWCDCTVHCDAEDVEKEKTGKCLQRRSTPLWWARVVTMIQQRNWKREKSSHSSTYRSWLLKQNDKITTSYQSHYYCLTRTIRQVMWSTLTRDWARLGKARGQLLGSRSWFLPDRAHRFATAS